MHFVVILLVLSYGCLRIKINELTFILLSIPHISKLNFKQSFVESLIPTKAEESSYQTNIKI